MAFSHVWRTLIGSPVPINQLASLRRAWLLPVETCDVIHELGCASRRRGCRAGRRARDRRSTDVNINNALQSADRSVHHIPIVTSRLPSSSLLASCRRGLLYHGHRERRAPVRRPLQPEPQLRVSSTSGISAVGLLNARSVGDKSASIFDIIVGQRLHLFAVVETWHDDAHSPQLITCTPPGYSFIEKARPRSESAALSTGTNHGGLCLFYASFLDAREVPLPAYKSGMEALAVTFHASRCNLLAVVLYRPGSADVTNAFFEDLSDVLERSATYACPFILLGDINIHTDNANNIHTIKWQTMLHSHGLVQHVTSPTHRAGHILDVVVTRTDCPVTDVQVLPPALSDHSFISVHVDLQSGRPHRPPAVRRRQWRSFDFDSFCDSLRQSVLLTDPPDDCASLIECYNTTLQSLLDQHAPFVVVQPRAHTNAPWYDRQCWTTKAATRRLERAYRRDKSESNRIAWKHQSQLLRATLRQRYVAYWSKTIADNSHDSKALWSKLDVLLKTTQQSSSTSHSAAVFADFFRSKVDKIRVETANAPSPIIVDRPCERLSALDDVTADEIRRLVVKAPTKHCSLDPAPTWLIKRTMPLLSDILAKICNTSFHEGLFPENLKLAMVQPRLKKITLDPDDLNSYRPISNLTFLSKIVERVAADRLRRHIESQQLFPVRQSAYRPHYSTETAVTAVHDEIIKSIDAGNVCAIVLLDLSAAFDTVDHQILLQIMNRRFGVAGRALDWCQSYLCQRSQTFCINGQQSGPFPVDCSVPQGSVLGPLEFIGYTEDLADLINSHRLSHHLYADDTQVIASTTTANAELTVDRLQQCVAEIHGWCSSRRLQMNPKKTEFIWFGSRANLEKLAASTATSSLTVSRDVVQRANAFRDLGVILDSELSMQNHISKVTQTCFYHIRRLKQVRKLLGPDVAAKLVVSLVFTRLDYCNATLAGLPKSTIAPLQRVQNAAARLVARLGPYDHVTATLKDRHWLPIAQRIEFKLCVLMHQVHIGLAPSYLRECVTASADVISRPCLRSTSSQRYERVRTRLKFGERSFSCAGPRAWNSLPSSLQELTDTKTFKRKLKTFLFQQAYH